MTIPDIFLVVLQKYISSLQVYIPYVRTTFRYSHCSLGSQRYLWIFTGSGTKMRLPKQISIVYYGDQEPLINRNCQNQLMFLQGVSVQICIYRPKLLADIPINLGSHLMAITKNNDVSNLDQLSLDPSHLFQC